MSLNSDEIVQIMHATGFEYTEDIWWRDAEGTGDLEVFVPCNDVFAWGSSDVEEITPENLQVFLGAYRECEAQFGRYQADDAAILFAARVRGMRPQNAFLNLVTDSRSVALLEAAGPERPVDVGNPKERRELHSLPPLARDDNNC